MNGHHNLCPGTAQNIIVSATVHEATRTDTQIARPSRSFLTYGSRMCSVRNGVDSDWPKKTSTGSSSYWCEIRKRMASVYGMKS